MEQKPNFKVMKSFAYSGGDINGEPIGIHIIKSGWRNPDLYHVIIEHGDTEQQDYLILSKEHLLEQLGISLGDEKDFGEMVHTIPNDMELGKAIREYFKKDY